jgi:hypothetical protein
MPEISFVALFMAPEGGMAAPRNPVADASAIAWILAVGQ